MNGWSDWGVALCLALLIFLLAKFGWNLRQAEIDRRMRWILPMPLLFVPLAALWGFNEQASRGSKTVEFCGSCHAMAAHVNDIYDPVSTNLATLHIQNRSVNENQCYTCHTGYKLIAPMKAKAAGLRHLLNYYVIGYDTPIKIHGKYDYETCFHCHGNARSYRAREEHAGLWSAKDMLNAETRCQDCHGDMHPTPTDGGHVVGVQGGTERPEVSQ